MRTLAQYLALITSKHAGKPKFASVVTASVAPEADLQRFFLGVPAAFDLDLAIGVQLDVVGQWAGISRQVSVPLISPWMSLDDATRGLDRAPLQEPYDIGSYYSALDDDTYRRAIRAKVLANAGNSTIGVAYAALREFLPAGSLLIVTDDGYAANGNQFVSFDNAILGLDGPAILYTPGATVATIAVLDMHMTVGVAGKWPSTVDAHVLSEQLIPIKPDGVSMDVFFPSVYGTPIFGLDVENAFISGCDVGSIGASADDIAYLPIDPTATPLGNAFSPDYAASF
jgi:hypothetical protein